MPLFDIDLRGFREILVKDSPRILLEPLANALDTEATQIIVTFSWARGTAEYSVEDNDPSGFASLDDAYTLYAPSQRKGDPTKRGRFGLGEKEFVALCAPNPVTIRTTSGEVRFEGDERRVSRRRTACTAAGTSVNARMRLSREHAEEFVARLGSVLVPEGVTLTLKINKVRSVLNARGALRMAEVTLPTHLADDAGVLRPTRRRTKVTVHAVESDEVPTLYELGMPVMAHHGAWHLNVHQKIPLARSRDAVTPAYLRDVQVAALNVAADLLSSEAARADWVLGALPHTNPDTLRSIVQAVHGDDAVIADPSCPEATKRALDRGRAVVHGRAYPAEVWKAIKEHEVLRPAGHYQDLRGDVPTSSTGIPPIPGEAWQPEWRGVAEYARALALELTGEAVKVTIYSVPRANWLAMCAAETKTLGFNAGRLPSSWWSSEEDIDELLLHELAHLYEADHLTDAFHQACTRLGARLRNCKARLQDFFAPPSAAHRAGSPQAAECLNGP